LIIRGDLLLQAAFNQLHYRISGRRERPLQHIPPPALLPDGRLRLLQASRLPARLQGEQHVRGGSLPLLSIEQFNNQYLDDDDGDLDESILVTPSHPSKHVAIQLGKQSNPPSASSSREGIFSKSLSRQRSQMISRLDTPPSSSSSFRSPSTGFPRASTLSNNLAGPGNDFMTSLRQRTASAVGSIVSLLWRSERYSEMFVAIEWDKYS